MSYFTCKDKHGLFVQSDRVAMVRAAPILQAPLPPQATPVRPFEISETTSRLVKLSKDFSISDENRPTSSVPSAPSAGLVAPSTPKKNILDMSSMTNNNTYNSTTASAYENVMATAIRANVGGTPGSNALSRELMRRQDEVNMLRKQVEPLLYQAKRVASAGGPAEHLKVLVDRISGMMEQYDKVVSRYERQLQKLILHMDKKRAVQQANQAESERSIGHQLSLKGRQVEDLKERLTATETQMRLLRKEYEQAQRNLSMRLTIEEETTNELSQLRSELERLRSSVGTTGTTGTQSIGVQSYTGLSATTGTQTQTSALVQDQIEMLTAALEASRQENQELKRQRETLYKPDGHHHTDSHDAVKEVLKAKDRQEAYFTELIETLKKDHVRASETLQAALSQARSDLEDTRHQLEEQSQRALKYSQAIDQTSDKCYHENRQLVEQLESLQSDLRERNKKMSELADATEQLRSEREERDQQIRKLEQRLVGMSSSMARSSSTTSEKSESGELSEAKKQIRVLEQTILELSEKPGTSNTEGASKVELLQRQLAQVEFEKQQIEATLKQERQQKNAKRPSNGARPATVHGQVDERAAKIKAELDALKPAVPKLMDRLSSLFSALQTNRAPNTSSATPLNLDAVNRAYTDIKHSFESLEASRQKALSSIHQAGNQVNVPAPNSNGLDTTMVMQGESHVERTPTMNRFSFGGHPL